VGCGQMSRMGQGTWSTTKRVARAEAACAESAGVAVAGEDEQVGAGGGVHDFAFDAAAAFESGGGAVESAGGGARTARADSLWSTCPPSWSPSSADAGRRRARWARLAFAGGAPAGAGWAR
jgi:hypothetical protein